MIHVLNINQKERKKGVHINLFFFLQNVLAKILIIEILIAPVKVKEINLSPVLSIAKINIKKIFCLFALCSYIIANLRVFW